MFGDSINVVRHFNDDKEIKIATGISDKLLAGGYKTALSIVTYVDENFQDQLYFVRYATDESIEEATEVSEKVARYFGSSTSVWQIMKKFNFEYDDGYAYSDNEFSDFCRIATFE